MQLLTQVKALVFDAYGTLFDVYSLGKRLRYHFPQKAEQINPIWRNKQLEYTWLRSLMRQYVPFSQVTADALTFACKETNTTISNEIHQDLMQHYFTLDAFPKVSEVLTNLQHTHQLAILSNANHEMLNKAAKHNAIDQYLTAILSVDIIKKYKPNPEVYQIAENKLGLDRAEIAFISSNTWDVAGAKSFGLNVIWLNRGGGKLEELGFQPDEIVSSIEELLE